MEELFGAILCIEKGKTAGRYREIGMSNPCNPRMRKRWREKDFDPKNFPDLAWPLVRLDSTSCIFLS